MATWPGSLPQEPDADGFQHTPGTGTVRTEMDAGPAKLRRRTTAVVDRVQCRITSLTDAQKTTLRGFYETTLEQGSLKFTWTDFLSGNSAEYRFVGEPVFKPQSGVLWMVEMELEILP